MRLIRLLKQDLSREIEEWVDEDIITASQQAKLLQRYGIEPGSTSSLGYQMLVGLGLLFAGLSLITLIGANWEDIPRYVRTLALITLTAGTQLYGYLLFRAQQETKAVGVFFLGNLFYGAAIILIAQIFHLGEHMPDGVYFWALGCVPLVFITRSRVLALQALVLAYIWLFMEANLGYLPLTFPIFIVASLYVLRFNHSVLLFLGSVSASVLWIEYVAAWFWNDGYRLTFSAEHVPLTASLFAVAYGLSHYLTTRQAPHLRDYGTVLAAWCLRFVIVFLLVLTFEDPWRSLIKADWDNGLSLIAVCMVIWALAIYLGYLARHVYSLIAFAAMMFVTGSLLANIDHDVHATLFQTGYNLTVIGLGIWLITRGIHHKISHYFWSGILSILAIALFRYFDLIGSYIGGSILFLFIAAILLGAARYWRALAKESEQP